MLQRSPQNGWLKSFNKQRLSLFQTPLPTLPYVVSYNYTFSCRGSNLVPADLSRSAGRHVLARAAWRGECTRLLTKRENMNYEARRSSWIVHICAKQAIRSAHVECKSLQSLTPQRARDRIGGVPLSKCFRPPHASIRQVHFHSTFAPTITVSQNHATTRPRSH